jgi:hypothetical protein
LLRILTHQISWSDKSTPFQSHGRDHTQAREARLLCQLVKLVWGYGPSEETGEFTSTVRGSMDLEKNKRAIVVQDGVCDVGGCGKWEALWDLPILPNDKVVLRREPVEQDLSPNRIEVITVILVD